MRVLSFIWSKIICKHFRLLVFNRRWLGGQKVAFSNLNIAGSSHPSSHLKFPTWWPLVGRGLLFEADVDNGSNNKRSQRLKSLSGSDQSINPTSHYSVIQPRTPFFSCYHKCANQRYGLKPVNLVRTAMLLPSPEAKVFTITGLGKKIVVGKRFYTP